ncbi:pyridoxal kinase PdxY [Providencia alcalifaciens]|uniref:pyridoxal kinase PdxY n=1 Tax=Providencia alcalifaciens TaxID=126385 RepID=UPI001CC65AE8|nr:pyridoxal kinase PdxY [Providencia alcalifaciens]CAG9414609.1 Pyridoxal kinase PdxY [Providencia alcalifaciens]CAG9418677.1 Pyridoxal kinase PdxY [Providencia alcalifaciens]CAG9419667.1 Pyridoxal kinase PdxY [Providencia alcalifaciens]CAG9419831.1 Pyridoxal kinase PdxY [Providencia alcalifaciens]CAG9422347.1 Pyridoxal kinase PdxY [Providencia alcalifaciens]
MKSVLSIQSHVVFGHAGNSAAAFPMCRMGVDVWPLNTVQFSNHTQYPQWTGSVFPAQHLTDIVEGLAKIHKLEICDAVLSGYIGSAEQGSDILAIVKKVKAANHQALYFCDPVMGHPEKGCIVAPGVAEFLCQQALAASDVIAPNLLELETLANEKITTVEQAVNAARKLCHQGPKTVLVKHLSRAGYRADRFEMILVTAEHSWHVSRPLVDFGEKQPVGVGDLTSGLMLVNILKGEPLNKGLEHVAAAVYEVMLKTKEMGEYELQLVAAQDLMVNPQHKFCATQLD